jgi:Ser/Thr protein kinase RdoA (MazF antagonist)
MADKRGYLPETPQEITADWLGSALGATVSNVEQQPLGDGKGFMGDVLRLDIDTDDSRLPRSLVAKLPKKANRVFGELLGVYEREIMFFREFGESLPIRAPKLWFSEFDRDKGSEKQEDILRSLDRMPKFLGSAIGVIGTFIAARKKRRYMLLIEFFQDMQPGDQLAGLEPARCAQVLRSIAPLHQKYWQAPQLDGHFWLLPLDIDARIRHGMFLQHLDRYGTVLGERVASHLAWLRDHGEALMRTFFADAPVTLLHCDLRLDNVVFGGDECGFIDFQLVRKGPAAYDVAYFMTSAMREDASADEEETALRAYHEALAVPQYTYEEFKRDYQRALMVVLAGLAGADDVEFGNERGENMMAAWMRRLTARAANVNPADLQLA